MRVESLKATPPHGIKPDHFVVFTALLDSAQGRLSGFKPPSRTAGLKPGIHSLDYLQ
jgi:hypothetical protein